MDPLIARLTPVAEKVRRIGNRVVRIEERYLQRRQSPRDAEQHALVAVFEAFIGMGGNVEAPEAFPWDTQQEDLLKEGLKRFVETYQGAKSVVGDFQMRESARRVRSDADTRSWSAWRGLRFTPAKGRRSQDSRAVELIDASTLSEQPIDDAHLAQVLAVMERELTPREYEWVTARYLYNVNITALVADLGARNPYYTGADGERRAEAVINTAISRARAKLRRVLAAERVCA